MKGKMVQKLLCGVILVAVVSGLAGCGGGKSPADPKPTASSTGAESTQKPKEQVSLKFFSNSPDRNNGVGKLEDEIAAQYMKENTNVKIEFEALQDEPYKQKFKAYTASNELPDIFMVWGQSAFFGPVMKGGYAAELNPKDYENYNFVKGTLDGYSQGGKLYGLPRNLDCMALFYNKALFEKNGVKVPTTYSELLDAAKAFRAKGIAPLAINGKDKWILGILYQDLVVKYGGDQKLIYNAIEGKTKFATDPVLLKGAQMMKELVDAKLFQDSFTSADYGAANNLFAQEKAAMYYMGSWTMSMATDVNFSDSFKNNVGVIKFPKIADGKGKDTDILAWCGAGYAVSAKSKQKAEATKFLNYMFKPENSAKLSWQSGAQVPAQDYSKFMTGKESGLQKEITKIIGEATSTSGVVWYDSATPAFKTDGENLSQEIAAGIKTPEEFLKECDKAVANIKN